LNLLDQLIRDVPWNPQEEKIVFLGDLIDRGPESPGVIERLISLREKNPNVVVLRGNHEQMLLDCHDYGDFQWLIPENGGLATLAAYGIELSTLKDVSDIRIPNRHIEFLRSLDPYHEDQDAIYVHAGLIPNQHPSTTDPEVMMWTRDFDFYRGYTGKLCFFGHTPTRFLPREGRRGRHGIYINRSCVGIDTSGDEDSPLSCIRVDSFTLYQAYPSGVTTVERLGRLKPREL
jgi:serine/threonine protein phosphatase 1